MIPFKIHRGLKANIPETKTDGYIYICTDTGEWYFDYTDEDGSLGRRQITDTQIAQHNTVALYGLLDANKIATVMPGDYDTSGLTKVHIQIYSPYFVQEIMFDAMMHELGQVTRNDTAYVSQGYVSPRHYTPELGDIFFVFDTAIHSLEVYCYLPAGEITMIQGSNILDPTEDPEKNPLDIVLCSEPISYDGDSKITAGITYTDCYSVDTIRPGTFWGTVKANENNQAADISLLRNSRVVLSDDTIEPDVEGEIVWVCK